MNAVLSVAGGVIGAVYVLFVPGWVLSFAFFRRGRVDVIERVALSFALSIAVVPLVAFYLNLLGVRISRVNVVLEVAAITAAAGAVAWWRARRRKPVAKPAPVAQSRPSAVKRERRRIQF